MRFHPSFQSAAWFFLLAFSVLTPVGKAAVGNEFDPLVVDTAMGDYEGHYLATGREPETAKAQVIPEGTGTYRVRIATSAGPDDFWPPRIEIEGRQEGEHVLLGGMSGGLRWEGEIANGHLNVRVVPEHYGGAFELAHVLKQSPTAGMKPPEGAVVLLPFSEGQETDTSAWTNGTWKPQPDGSMRVGEGATQTKSEFGDIELHVEFAIPYEPEGRSQDRGNSGVYLQSRYEPQVLDSYGLILRAGDCGSLYQIAIPAVNACLPPLSWQTYDIVFQGPRFNADGSIKNFPWITLSLNGVQLHERQELPHSTVGGAEGFVEKAPILLQDHGHPVRYRNIWLVEKGK
jgi:hypothetical protein